MKKNSLLRIYGANFVLSLILYVFTIYHHITSPVKQWFPFVLSLAIMFLSLWGYFIVNKYMR